MTSSFSWKKTAWKGGITCKTQNYEFGIAENYLHAECAKLRVKRDRLSSMIPSIVMWGRNRELSKQLGEVTPFTLEKSDLMKKRLSELKVCSEIVCRRTQCKLS